MESKAVVYGLLFLAVLPFVSAVNCWGIHEMPTGSWDYDAWLCNSTQQAGYYKSTTGVHPFSIMMHGQIQTTNPSDSSVWRVYLQSFTYSSPYPAVLKCYKRMGVSGSYWWWYTGQQVTLNAGQQTSDSSPWVVAGCPPIKNLNQQDGSPPRVRIYIAWSGFLLKSGRKSLGIESNIALPVKARIRRG